MKNFLKEKENAFGYVLQFWWNTCDIKRVTNTGMLFLNDTDETKKTKTEVGFEISFNDLFLKSVFLWQN